MPGENASSQSSWREPGDRTGLPSSHSELAELAALARVSRMQSLDPIPEGVAPEIRDFAETLRMLFAALGMSLNRLAALLHTSPGTVSRYLSGQRIPPPDFIDRLCKAVYDAKGSLLTEQVVELVNEQFLVALRDYNPARYEVQRLANLLQVAAQEKTQYEITVDALQEAIASRKDRIYALELEGRQLRSAWLRAEELLEEEREHRKRLEQTIDSLYTQVSFFKGRLESAQQRAAEAEGRCLELEAQLDAAGALLPDEDQPTGGPVGELGSQLASAATDNWPLSGGQGSSIPGTYETEGLVTGAARPRSGAADSQTSSPGSGGQEGSAVNPLLQRIAQRQIEQANSFARQMPLGSEIVYEGEDRDWLLNLTREAERSIDSISLTTVDAGMYGFDGGLWTSDLGVRYMELQREAVARLVIIRRIFVSESVELRYDETFMRVTQMQRDLGIQSRMLYHRLIPDLMRSAIFDFTIFDNIVLYEKTPATTFTAGQTRPGIVRTMLTQSPARIRELQDRFELLWAAADPERQIDELE
jgi:transcriptional regulator with XRE-family HTH domain